MSVIHIYGASGSGTSTLGKAISDRYKYKQLDTDDYFWVLTEPPYLEKRPAERRLELMIKDLKDNKNTVISGSLCGWGDPLIPLIDIAVRLIVPKDLRMERLKRREYQRFGSRIEVGGDMYDANIKFIQWASEYDDGDISMRSKALHDKWSEELTCQQIVLDGTLPLETLLEEIKATKVL